MKKIAIGAILVLIVSSAMFGQEKKIVRYDPDPYANLSEKEIKALYKKALAEDAVPKGAIELELKFKIPLESEVDEKEIYFKNNIYFSVDERGRVYAPDSYLRVVYEFDKDGKLITKYNKAGQGPGELNFPLRILFDGDYVVLHESVIGKLFYFNRDWTYSRSLAVKNDAPFGIASNGDIYCLDGSRKKLIGVWDSNGKLIRRFGEPRFPQKPESPLNAVIAGLSPSGSIWVCFTALGTIRKYSMTGELLKEIDFRENMSELIKTNIKENFELDRKGKREWSPVFTRIAFFLGDILITGGGVTNPIYRLDDNGNVKTVYFIKPEYQIPRDCQFAAVGDNGEELFFVRTEIGDRAIGVYRRKRQDILK